MQRLLGLQAEAQLTRSRATSHLAAITHIGIDEKFWQGRGLCLVVDLVSGRLIDLLPDREPETVRQFLVEFKELHGGTPVFVTDMWQPFRAVIRDVYLHEAKHVADRFHITAKINEDLYAIAKVILAPGPQRVSQLRAVNASFLSALKGAGSLPVPDATTEQESLLDQAVTLACEAARLWESASTAEFASKHADWEWNVFLFSRQLYGYGPVYPFGRLLYLLEYWREEIYAYCDPNLAITHPNGTTQRPSNGRVEALNGWLDHFLLGSGAQRRSPYARPSNTKTWQEQEQFERLWLRVMSVRNLPALPQQTFTTTLRPLALPCSCSQLPDAIEWKPGGRAYDVPLGGQPVIAELARGNWQCRCGQAHELEVAAPSGMTTRLLDHLRHERQRGVSWNALTLATGVPYRTLKSALAQDTVSAPPVHYPPLIGLNLAKARSSAICDE